MPIKHYIFIPFNNLLPCPAKFKFSACAEINMLISSSLTNPSNTVDTDRKLSIDAGGYKAYTRPRNLLDTYELVALTRFPRYQITSDEAPSKLGSHDQDLGAFAYRITASKSM